MRQVAALRKMEDVPYGTYGEVVDKYEYLGYLYIVVQFENGVQLEFGDKNHPLIPYKSWITLI